MRLRPRRKIVFFANRALFASRALRIAPYLTESTRSPAGPAGSCRCQRQQGLCSVGR